MDTLTRLTMLLMVVFFGACIWLAFESSREWDAYVAEHNCREVSRAWRGGQFQLMPAGNGQMIPYWVDQGDAVTYLCDNGYITR